MSYTHKGFVDLLGLVDVLGKARNKEVSINCDNVGFIAVYMKKHGECPNSHTLAKAIHDVPKGLGCKVNVLQTKRCSGTGAKTANALSKSVWVCAWANMPWKSVDNLRIPVSFPPKKGGP